MSNGIDRLYELTVRQLKAKAEADGLDTSRVLEKSDLIDLFRRQSRSGMEQVDLEPAGVKCQTNFEEEIRFPISPSKKQNEDRVSTGSPAIAMSVSDLRDIIRSHAGRCSSCTEKVDLFNLAKSLLSRKTCIVCTGELLEKFSDSVIQMKPCCNVVIHDDCLRKWIITSVIDRGQFPAKCPNCEALLAESWIGKHVMSAIQATRDHARYVSAVENAKQLRNRQPPTSSSSDDTSGFLKLGYRQCPKCHTWIEKGPSMEAFGIAMVEGCDKMTCRCGCQFCFKCGSISANCSCTGPEHGFFSHQDVLADYPKNNISSPVDFINTLF